MNGRGKLVLANRRNSVRVNCVAQFRRISRTMLPCRRSYTIHWVHTFDLCVLFELRGTASHSSLNRLYRRRSPQPISWLGTEAKHNISSKKTTKYYRLTKKTHKKLNLNKLNLRTCKFKNSSHFCAYYCAQLSYRPTTQRIIFLPP